MSGVSFGEARRSRRPSLTPMIDVVFLLLVFFMLAARFGIETVLPIAPAVPGSADWEGPPRLVTVGAGSLALNGRPVPPDALVPALRRLMAGPDAPVILRPGPAARLQDVVDVAARLRTAGIGNLVLLR
jgi:biopolymer transport protein ExbD